MTDAAITYRDKRPGDFKDLHELVSIWKVARNLGSWPWPPDPEFTRTRCVPFDGDGFIWAICKDDVLIGTVGVKCGALGYMLHPDHQGRGVVQHAVRKALTYAFELERLNAISAHIWEDNHVSRHVLEKFGFRLTKQEVVQALARDAMTARETYVLTTSEWSSLMHLEECSNASATRLGKAEP